MWEKREFEGIMTNYLKPLMLGDLEVKVPIIQGGMGVMISGAPLAAAVANHGAAGTLASVGLGYGTEENNQNFVKASHDGLEQEINLYQKLTNGVVGVNIMVAVNNYDDLIQTAVTKKVDFIASGAGLPLSLPEITKGSSIKLLPIVSSSRAAAVILKTWKRRYNRVPDAVIVEGPLAGGHLGYKFEELIPPEAGMLEKIFVDVLKVVREYSEAIPVIAAGGIYDGRDIARFIKLGASGVQMATRFVATYECPAHESFKKLYISATEDDIAIIKSPVGMPGRVIKTEFTKRVLAGERVKIKCNYRCLKTCDPSTVPYCIAEALFNAVSGNMDKAVVFAGSNVSRITKIVSVKELIDELVEEANAELAAA